MKKLFLYLAVLMLTTACSTAHRALPFAPDGKYGKYPTLRNKPDREKTAWIYRQWGKEGR